MPSPHAHPSPENCLQRVASGDEAALRELYNLFAPQLMGLAYRILERRQEAEEVIQDTFIQVWKNAHRFDPTRSSAKTWLYLITRSRAIDRLRRLRGQAPLVSTPFDETAEQTVAFDQPSDSELENHPALRRLKALSPRQRETIELAFFEGYTHAEIANLKDIPLGTVKSDIRRSLQRLKTNGGPSDA